MRMHKASVLALCLLSGCGGDSPTSSSGPANLAGGWTYRQQAPASCPLPASHRTLTLPATLVAMGGNAYTMTLAGTDSSASYSFFYWAGSSYRGSILYTRRTGSELAVFTVNDAAFSASANSMSASTGGEYQYLGTTLVDCMGTFTISLTR